LPGREAWRTPLCVQEREANWEPSMREWVKAARPATAKMSRFASGRNYKERDARREIAKARGMRVTALGYADDLGMLSATRAGIERYEQERNNGDSRTNHPGAGAGSSSGDTGGSRSDGRRAACRGLFSPASSSRAGSSTDSGGADSSDFGDNCDPQEQSRQRGARRGAGQGWKRQREAQREVRQTSW
jgi:hypothetical protein